MTLRRGAAGVLAAALLLYLPSAAPGVLWGDSAKLTLMAQAMELKTNPGGHPGYVMLAGGLVRALPFDAARLLNLLSAVFGALGVVATFAAGRRLGGPWAGLAAAATLAVAHVYWLASSIAETYAPAVACLAGGVWALLRWVEVLEDDHAGLGETTGRSPLPWAVTTGALLGIGGSFNAVVLLATPGLVLPLLRRLRPTTREGALGLAAGALAGFVALAPYWAVALLSGDIAGPGRGIGFELAAYFGGGGTLGELLRMPAYLAYQLPGPAALLAPAGLAVLWRSGRRHLAVSLGASAMTVVLFAAVWLRQRQFLILDAALVPIALLAGVATPLAAAWIAERVSARERTVAAGLALAPLLLAPMAYLLTPPVATALGVDLVGARTLPYREAATYYLRPWKGGYDGAARYVAEAGATLQEGDVVYADFTPERPLAYGLPSGIDVRQTDRFIFGNDADGFVAELESTLAGGRRVFLGDDHDGYYYIPRLEERFTLRREGVLIRVLPR